MNSPRSSAWRVESWQGVGAENTGFLHLWVTVEVDLPMQNGEIYLTMLDEQGLSLYIYIYV